MQRLGLNQAMRAEQRLQQSPQMIQAMKILQCPMQDLLEQVEQELAENVFLEVAEESEDGPASGAESQAATESNEPEDRFEADLEAQISKELDRLEERADDYSVSGSPNQEEADRRYEMLLNTADTDQTLSDFLLEQVGLMDLRPELTPVVEHVVFSLDEEGRLHEPAEQVADDLIVPIPLAEEAIQVLRGLDPAGVGARDLQDCLLLQLDRLNYVPALTRALVRNHLDDLALNKLPKIARDTSSTIDEIKESWDFLRAHLNPHPGARFQTSKGGVVAPDVVVEEVDGRFEVRSQRGNLPDLRISQSYRKLLKGAKQDPKIAEFLKRRIEAAKWFIESIHQRQDTITLVATEIVKRQSDFLREGVSALRPMKMQDIAIAVNRHISTVSRAVSGKYIQTPQGILDMKRFFSGGTVTDSGKMMSQQAVKQLLESIVAEEDKAQPLSDDQLVDLLGEKGVHIARRTVTKYRKALGIESSSRRKEY